MNTKEIDVDNTTGTNSFTIDCSSCVGHKTAACDDCVVAFLLDDQDTEATIIDADEARVIRMLARSGLVQPVRHLPRTG